MIEMSSCLDYLPRPVLYFKKALELYISLRFQGNHISLPF